MSNYYSPSKISNTSLLTSSEIIFEPINYEKYQDMENELTETQIIEFIKKKATDYKRNMIQTHQQLSADLEFVQSIIFEINKNIRDREGRLKQITDNKQQNQLQLTALNKKHEDNEKRLQEKQAKLKDKQVPIKKLMEEYEHAKKEITSETLKKVNLYLQKNSNESVSFIFEALIGIIRGMKFADAQSVEIYLKGLDGLQMGLKKIDFKKVNNENAKFYIDQLTMKHDKVLVSSEFKIFLPFRNLLSKICLIAILTKGVDELEQSINTKNIELHQTEKDIDSKEALIKHLNIVDLLNQDLEYLKTKSSVFFLDKEARIKSEMLDIETKLNKFESTFFESL